MAACEKEVLLVLEYTSRVWDAQTPYMQLTVLVVCCFVILFRAALYGALCWVVRSVGALPGQLYAAVLSLERSMEKRREIHENNLRLESTNRKSGGLGTPSPRKRREHGRHRRTPLLKEKKTREFDYVFLPEELPKLRHMYDPVYFNRVRRIGAGAYGLIYQVEHRITGKMMALKTLAPEMNSDEEANLEIRALLRLHFDIWCPKVLSTFKDNEGYHILMVCRFIFTFVFRVNVFFFSLYTSGGICTL